MDHMSFEEILFSGCDGGGGSDPSAEGTWDFILNFVSARLILEEDENGQITGTFEWIGESFGATSATSVTGTRDGAGVTLTIIFDNGATTTITGSLDGDTLKGNASTDPAEPTAPPQTQEFEATRTARPEPEPEPEPNPVYSTYAGTEDGTVTVTAPDGQGGTITVSGPFSAPMQAVVGPDGKFYFPETPGVTVTQEGSDFVLTVVAESITISWSGTINGDTITGTISGGGAVGPATTSVEGTFNLQKTGEEEVPPDMEMPSMPDNPF